MEGEGGGIGRMGRGTPSGEQFEKGEAAECAAIWSNDEPGEQEEQKLVAERGQDKGPLKEWELGHRRGPKAL